jgi:hypothetical protein
MSDPVPFRPSDFFVTGEGKADKTDFAIERFFKKEEPTAPERYIRPGGVPFQCSGSFRADFVDLDKLRELFADGPGGTLTLYPDWRAVESFEGIMRAAAALYAEGGEYARIFDETVAEARAILSRKEHVNAVGRAIDRT